MGGLVPFGVDEEEALEKLERLWIAYEEASDAADRYAGSMGWKPNAGQDYLVHTLNLRYEGNRQRARSLGPRSGETERRKAEFDRGRERTRTDLDRIRERLDTHARVLKALRIGRFPAVAARFLRELRDAGFGAGHFGIGGGAALAAYEFRSRMRMPVGDGADPDFDLLPTDLFVRDRQLFDAIASRKIFGPIRVEDDRIVLGRGVAIRLLSKDVAEGWIRSMHRGRVGDEEIEAVRWAFAVPEALPMLAVGSDGTPAPVAALDPRAFAVLATVEGRHLADPPRAERLLAEARAVAGIAAGIVAEPFERGHLALFPEIADAVGEGGLHADDRIVMRP